MQEIRTDETRRASYFPEGRFAHDLYDAARSMPDRPETSGDSLAYRTAASFLSWAKGEYGLGMVTGGCAAAVAVLSQRHFEHGIAQAGAISFYAAVGAQVGLALSQSEPKDRLAGRRHTEVRAELLKSAEDAAGFAVDPSRTPSERTHWSRAAWRLRQFAETLDASQRSSDWPRAYASPLHAHLGNGLDAGAEIRQYARRVLAAAENSRPASVLPFREYRRLLDSAPTAGELALVVGTCIEAVRTLQRHLGGPLAAEAGQGIRTFAELGQMILADDAVQKHGTCLQGLGPAEAVDALKALGRRLAFEFAADPAELPEGVRQYWRDAAFAGSRLAHGIEQHAERQAQAASDLSTAAGPALDRRALRRSLEQAEMRP